MPTETAPHLFEHAVLGAAAWIDEVAAELDLEDRRAARRALRSVLHAIRDRLEPNEAAQLAAELPELIRALYWDGWKPGRHSPRHVDAFLETIAEAADLSGTTEASLVLNAVMTVLRRHVSPGELDGVVTVMPTDLRPLLAG